MHMDRGKKLILYYTVLQYTSLYYTMLYSTIIYYTSLYYNTLYSNILYHTIPHCTILYYTILYYTILYYTILYYTLWSRVIPEKLTFSQLIRKFLMFCRNRSFITAFTSPRHVSLSWARLIQSVPPYPTSCRTILILSSHLSLVLPSLFSLRTPHQNPVCTSLLPHT